jgi:hypothetical protein
VNWVLAGSGSLSSGSARSRSQLIAAQRLDPQRTLFPKADDNSMVPVKKGNPWTERKEIVAAGLGVRVRSSGKQEMVLLDTEKSSVSAGLPSPYRLHVLAFILKILPLSKMYKNVTFLLVCVSVASYRGSNVDYLKLQYSCQFLVYGSRCAIFGHNSNSHAQYASFNNMCSKL